MTTSRNRAKASDPTPDDVDQADQADQAEAEPTGAASDADRDATIAELRAELDRIRSTPEGQAFELAKALDALAKEVERMKAGQGLVPVPAQTEPAPYDYWARLASGEVIEVQFPWITHHHSDEYGLVPVERCWEKDKDAAAAA